MKKLIILLLFCNLSFSQQIIKLKKIESGLYEVNSELNSSIKLPFLVDTGASDVFVPPSVVKVLILNKTLTVNDTLQGKYYTFGNGQTTYCRRFVIRKLKIGNVILRNVNCTVGNTDDTLLLLGQSALQKFKNYKIDNIKHILIVTK
jgi:clan AA aspartic protease (TIGR02281 family)